MQNYIRKIAVLLTFLLTTIIGYAQNVSKIESGELASVLTGIASMQHFETDQIRVAVFKVMMETDRIPGSESHELFTRLYIVVSEIGTYAPSNVYLIKNLYNVDKVFFKEIDRSTLTIDFLEGPYLKRIAKVIKINSENLTLALLK